MMDMCGERGRWRMPVIMYGLIMVASGCVVDTPSVESLSCEGQAMTQQAECIDGRWVVRPSVMPVLDMDAGRDAAMDAAMDALPDLPVVDMPSPDLGDPCSSENVERLCAGVECGAPETLQVSCPGQRCLDTCDPLTQQCMGTECIRCIEPDSVDNSAMDDAALCRAAASQVFESAPNTAIDCGVGASPATKICGDRPSLNCAGICPGALICGAGEVCCPSPEDVQRLCEELSIVEVCQLERSSKQVRDCVTGNLVPLSEMCQSECPFDIAKELMILGAPGPGTGTLLTPHPVYPASDAPLFANNLVYWLRPSDAFFKPDLGIWTAVTGPTDADRDDASLFDASGTLLATSTSADLLRADQTSTNDRDLNFNPYVDLGGGFVEFDRPANFKGDVSIFMVVRNKMGDEKPNVTDEMWYQRPAILSGEHGGSHDFGLTLEQGKLEWSRAHDADGPAATSRDLFNDGMWHVVVVTRRDNSANGNVTIHVDGEEQGTGRMQAGDFENMITRIGRHPAPWSDEGEWHGDVAEVILYERSTNDAIQARIQTYLALKYGVTLKANYKDAQDTVIYDVEAGAGEHVFGLMCSPSFALQQYAARGDDGLLSLRAGDVYKGVDNCPMAPSSFSLVVGDDGGPLTASGDLLEIKNRGGRAMDVTVSARTWKIRSSTDTPAAFTVTLDAMHPDFIASNFLPDMIVLTDADGKQLVVPVKLFEGRYYVTTFLTLSNAGLKLSDYITMQFARFE